jgi:hypothetical protein
MVVDHPFIARRIQLCSMRSKKVICHYRIYQKKMKIAMMVPEQDGHAIEINVGKVEVW